jgi:hypothetical protein
MHLDRFILLFVWVGGWVFGILLHTVVYTILVSRHTRDKEFYW